MIYHAPVKQTGTGDVYIELPPELMEAMKWDEDTILDWCIYEDGTIGLRKANDTSNEA